LPRRKVDSFADPTIEDERLPPDSEALCVAKVVKKIKGANQMFIRNIRWSTYPESAASEMGISVEIELRLLPFGRGPIIGRWVTGMAPEYLVPCPPAERVLWDPRMPAGTLSIRTKGISRPGHKIYAEGVLVKQDVTPVKLVSPSPEWTEWEHFTLNLLP
jgi:hypothetical protein